MNNPEQPELNQNIDFNQTTEETCEKCNSKVFTQVVMIRRLSALLSPTGQPTMIPIQMFACAKCNHVNTGFLPKE